MASNWIQVQGQGHCSPFTTKKKKKNHHRTRRTQQVATSLQQVKPQKKKKGGDRSYDRDSCGTLKRGSHSLTDGIHRAGGTSKDLPLSRTREVVNHGLGLTYGVGFCSLLCER